MNTRLSLFMVFLKSLLPAPGASLSPGLDPRCPADTTILGDDEWANITTMQNLTYDWSKFLYVHPDPAFKGVRLVAAGDGWQQDAWFTLDNTCFPLDARWWRLWARIQRRRNDDNNNDGFLGFYVRTGDCYLACHRTGHFLNAVNVTVVAHGPSRWRLTYPRQCSVEEHIQHRYSWINCNSHPPTTTTTIAIIVVPVMIGVAVVVVVLLVVLTKCYRQRRVNPVPRVPTRRGLAASWRVGGEVAVSDSHVEPPTGPTVLPRVAPRQQEHIFDDDDEEHIYDEFPDPLICQQIPEPPIYEEIPGPPIYEEIPGPPTYENISEHPPSHEAENFDSDDGGYLTPRRAPPGTPSGHPASHEAENLDSDDDAYLTPRRAPMGTPSGITKG
ncbi:uncharacterized protein LOC127001888 [Eriocheir sinensis]|uniref:uncharacterized protein LOC127001888 n=1 Tax=Eriocheir sinensis TaxID=95602 RepID=UPI0021C9C6B7|nr:uncharacterized protein LOC127001888 [Eriocheir sinensis]